MDPTGKMCTCYYHTYRTLASSATTNTLSNAARWQNFTHFSAVLLHQSDKEVFVKEIGIYAFFDLRNGLKMTVETHGTKKLRQNSVVSSEQAMEIDVVAAAQCVIHSGTKLRRLDNAVFGDSWTTVLSRKTELWDGEPEFSEARWEFWARRFEELAKEDWMSKEGREMATKAAGLIRDAAMVSCSEAED